MEATIRNPAKFDESDRGRADVVGRVLEALKGLRFGEIRIVVHEGTVVQVERTEKLRLPLPRSSP